MDAVALTASRFASATESAWSATKTFVRVVPNRKRGIKTGQTPTAADSAGFRRVRRPSDFCRKWDIPISAITKCVRKVKTRRGRLMTSSCRASRRPPELGMRPHVADDVGMDSEASEDRRKYPKTVGNIRRPSESVGKPHTPVDRVFWRPGPAQSRS